MCARVAHYIACLHRLRGWLCSAADGPLPLAVLCHPCMRPRPFLAQVHPSPLFAGGLSMASCGSPSSPAFWVTQLLASGMPWLVVHAVLFPLTINQGIVVHGVSKPGQCGDAGMSGTRGPVALLERAGGWAAAAALLLCYGCSGGAACGGQGGHAAWQWQPGRQRSVHRSRLPQPRLPPAAPDLAPAPHRN